MVNKEQIKKFNSDLKKDLRPFVYANKDYWDNIQKMANRMAFSEQKYGPVRDMYPDQADALASLEERIRLYKETGNVEWIIDAANFCVIEAMQPSHENAHFRSTDTDESPGVVARN